MYLQAVIIYKTAGPENIKAKAKQKPRDLDTLLHSKNCVYFKNSITLYIYKSLGYTMCSSYVITFVPSNNPVNLWRKIIFCRIRWQGSESKCDLSKTTVRKWHIKNLNLRQSHISMFFPVLHKAKGKLASSKKNISGPNYRLFFLAVLIWVSHFILPGFYFLIGKVRETD